MTLSTTENRTGRSLVPTTLFDRLVDRIGRDEDVTQDLATRIMDQALAFLGACAATEEALSPSKMVDIGWHTFILFTRDYRDWCHEIAGRFIHHDPTDAPETNSTTAPAETRDRTVTAIRAAGFRVDEELWTVAADCNQCKDGCTHSGGDTGCHSRLAPAGLTPATIER